MYPQKARQASDDLADPMEMSLSEADSLLALYGNVSSTTPNCTARTVIDAGLGRTLGTHTCCKRGSRGGRES